MIEGGDVKRIRIGAALLIATAAAPAALAHHSFAMFDQSKVVTLNGVVQEFEWTNPHAWIELMVPNASGTPVKWGIELNSPNNLTRQGWKRNSIQPGDKVTITLNPLRNGNSGGLFNQIVLPNGKVLGEAAITAGKPINVPTAN